MLFFSSIFENLIKKPNNVVDQIVTIWQAEEPMTFIFSVTSFPFFLEFSIKLFLSFDLFIMFYFFVSIQIILSYHETVVLNELTGQVAMI